MTYPCLSIFLTHYPYSLPLFKQQVLFNVPNLVGYFRVSLAIAGTCLSLHEPTTAFWCFWTSLWLDYVDGFIARQLKQVERDRTVLILMFKF